MVLEVLGKSEPSVYHTGVLIPFRILRWRYHSLLIHGRVFSSQLNTVWRTDILRLRDEHETDHKLDYELLLSDSVMQNYFFFSENHFLLLCMNGIPYAV